MIKPNFLIVGAAKSGTVSLYYYLNEHSKVCLPIKESFFFTSEFFESSFNSVEEYLHLFEKCKGSRFGEAGTSYLYYYKETIPKIKELVGDIKIIAILRNPVDRAYSNYTHFVRDGNEDLSFEAALEAEEKRMAEGRHFMFHYKRMGLYANQIESYQKAFSNVKVVLYDDLVADPVKLMQDLYEFLGVDSTFVPDTSTRFNVSGKPKNKGLQKLFRYLLFEPSWFEKILKPLYRPFESKIASFLHRRMQKNVQPKEEMNPETRKKLQEFFKEDILRLEKLIGRDLSMWYR